MKKLLVVIALVGLGFALAPAQTATPKVTKRQMRQQERINEGVKSGELTRREQKRLEHQQMKIETDKEKAKSDGVVTPKERAKLKREQDRASRNIYRKKHNERETK